MSRLLVLPMRVLLLWLALSLSACAQLPPLPPRTATQAFANPQSTPLGQRAAAERGNAAPSHSGLQVLIQGEQALATLIALVDASQATLDLQYYAVLNEASTRVLLQHVRAAAERGVRVRLLVDDINTSGTDDALTRLTRHPRIEVRLYNPLPSGRFSLVTKVISSLHDFDRINNRMHNKQLVADNAVAVTGGRNLGDAYFLPGKANFVDVDLLVVGPAVRALSAVFDRYWNSELAYPVEAITGQPKPRPDAPAQASAAPAPTAASRGAAAASAPGAAQPASAPALAASTPLDAPTVLPEPARSMVEREVQAMRHKPWRLHWAPARLLADAPSKSLAEGAPSDGETMFDDLTALLRSARQEVLLVTPYFVPGETGMAVLRELRQRGVRVRVLTASLGGTDAPIVHVGYSKYRKPLLEMGVELYELRPEFQVPPPAGRSGVESRTNLHAKLVLVDRRTALVGSMNFDPRSALHNTEMGLQVRSAALAAELRRLMDQAAERGAYRMGLTADGALRWSFVDEQGRPAELRSEPGVSAFKVFGLRLLSPLAPERML